jgi:MarR family transcriptional regulator, negative regulator of the multidrug operon emrRAB
MQHTYSRLANLLGVLSQAVADQMTEAMGAMADQGGGAPAALVQIADHPGLTTEELRRRIGLSHSATVRLIDRLAARGLVLRERNQQDARTAGLRLTAEGAAAAGSVQTAREQVTTAVVNRLAPGRQRELESLLDEMLTDMPATSEHGVQLCRLCCLRDCPADRCPVELRYQELLREGR